jgi:hypothetical protein
MMSVSVSVHKKLNWTELISPGLENRDYVVRMGRADHATPLYPQRLALTSSTSGGSSVDIVH